MLKVIVAGGRDFNDYILLKQTLNKLLQKRLQNKDVEIVSGGARGADALGERFAKEYNLPLHRKPADWNKYGKSAGYKRNAEMAAYADGCVCFWDGKSKGTKHMIDLAKQANIKLMIVQYEGKPNA